MPEPQETLPDIISAIETSASSTTTKEAPTANDPVINDIFKNTIEQTPPPATDKVAEPVNEPVTETKKEEPITEAPITNEPIVEKPTFRVQDVFGEEVPDIETAKSKYAELLARAEKAEKEKNEYIPPSISEEAMQYDAFMKTTGNKDFSTYQKLSGVDLETNDPNDIIELMVIQKQLEDKGISKEDLNIYRDYMKHKYKLSAEAMEDMTEQQVKFAQMELREAARPIKAQLSETISKFKSPEPINHREVYEKAKQSWQPEIEKWKSDETTKTINYKYGGDKKNGDEKFTLEVPFEISASEVEPIFQEALEVMAKNNVEVTPESISVAKQNAINYAKQIAIAKNFQTIVDKAVNLAIEANDKKWAKEVHQPDAEVKHNTPPIVQDAEIDTAKQFHSIFGGQN